MSATQPDHHDADLMLKVYDLRRETTLREARVAINAEFWPQSYEDIKAIVKLDHPLNVHWRQTMTYWEMVYGIARHGIVHPEFWMEGNGEGIFLFARVAPWLADLRRDVNPAAFRHAEWAATQTTEGRRLFELFGARIATTLAARRP
jgi:hypothetical protein